MTGADPSRPVPVPGLVHLSGLAWHLLPVPRPEGRSCSFLRSKTCVASEEYMRSAHMQLLIDWRDGACASITCTIPPITAELQGRPDQDLPGPVPRQQESSSATAATVT